MSDDLQPIDILNRLKSRGWRQGAYGRSEGPNCIVGAALQLRAERLALPLDEARVGWVNADWFQPIRDVSLEQYALEPVDFNDAESTTFTDIESLLEKAQIRWSERID